MKSEYLQIRISPQVKKSLAQRSAAIGMSISEYVRVLILEDIRKTEATGGAME